MDDFVRQIKALKKDVRDRALKVSGSKVRVMIDPEAKYEDGKSVADVARYIEYGTSKMAPRPFVRNAVAEHEREWDAMIQDVLLAVVEGDSNDYKRSLEAVSEEIRGDIKESCESFGIKDTGLLLNSIVAKVETRS